MKTEVHKLLDQHIELFHEQMRNWDKFGKSARKLGYISIAETILATILVWALLSWNRPNGALITIIAFAIIIPSFEYIEGWLLELHHRQIDRGLEQKKQEIEDTINKLILEQKAKLPVGVWAMKVHFDGPKRRRQRTRSRNRNYSPWRDFVYGYYWGD